MTTQRSDDGSHAEPFIAHAIDEAHADVEAAGRFRMIVQCRSAEFEETDLDAVPARRLQVALIDEVSP